MTLPEMSFYAAVMIIIIAVLRRLLLRQMPKTTFQVLWAAVLIRLIVPFSVSSPFSIYHSVGKLMLQTEQAGLIETIQPTEETESASLQNRPLTAAGNRELGITADDPAAESSPADSNRPETDKNRLRSPAQILRILWAVGAAVLAGIFLFRYSRSLRLFRMSLPTDSEWISAWLHSQTGRRNIQVRQSDMIDTPLAYGIFSPVILLPKRIVDSDPQKLSLILSHEIIHITHLDLIKKVILLGAVCIHWFNPFVWLMYILANRDIELACDEAVLRRAPADIRKKYALMLINMEEARTDFLPVNNFSNSALEERIGAIMKVKKKSLAASVMTALLVTGVTGAFATTAPEYNTEAASPGGQVQVLDETLVEMIKSVGWNRSLISDALTNQELMADYLDLYSLEQDGYKQKSVAEFDRSFEEWWNTHSYAEFIFTEQNSSEADWNAIKANFWPLSDPTFQAAYESLKANMHQEQTGSTVPCRTNEILYTPSVKEEDGTTVQYTIKCRMLYEIAHPELVTVDERNQVTEFADFAITNQLHSNDLQALTQMSTRDLLEQLSAAAKTCETEGIICSVSEDCLSFYKTENGLDIILGSLPQELTQPDRISADGTIGNAQYMITMEYDSGKLDIASDLSGFTDGMLTLDYCAYVYKDGKIVSVPIGKDTCILTPDSGVPVTRSTSIERDLAQQLLAIECRYTVIEYPYYYEGTLFQKLSGASAETADKAVQ